MAGLRAIVFDVSGVLRTTKPLVKRAYDAAFASEGLNINVDPEMAYTLRGLGTFNDLRNSLRLLAGTGGDVAASVVRTKGANKLLTEEMLARPVEEALLDRLQKAYRAEFSRPENRHLVSILPGVPEGLAALGGRFTLGVLSNSTASSVRRDLGPLEEHFAFVVADAGKPQPERYLEALAEHGLAPAETLYVGDAVSDVELAKRSGSPSAAMLTGMGSRKHLAAAEPSMVCATFGELVEKLAE